MESTFAGLAEIAAGFIILAGVLSLVWFREKGPKVGEWRDYE